MQQTINIPEGFELIQTSETSMVITEEIKALIKDLGLVLVKITKNTLC